MTTDNDNSDSWQGTPQSYLESIVELNGSSSACGNLQSGQRVGKNACTVGARCGLHDSDFYEFYPEGGLFEKLAKELGNIPSFKLDFGRSSADLTSDSSDPTSKPRYT